MNVRELKKLAASLKTVVDACGTCPVGVQRRATVICLVTDVWMDYVHTNPKARKQWPSHNAWAVDCGFNNT